jgi:hypothetical protein
MNNTPTVGTPSQVAPCAGYQIEGFPLTSYLPPVHDRAVGPSGIEGRNTLKRHSYYYCASFNSSQHANANSEVLKQSRPVRKLPLPLDRAHAPRPFCPLILSLRRQIHKDLLPPYLSCTPCAKSQCCVLRHRRPSAARWVPPVQEM